MATLPPNILWILTTQWRARATGYGGDPNARTPCLDAWANWGVVYTAAFTPHPFGPFARAAMLTGVPSPANGVRDYFDPLPRKSRTIAHDLEERGYTTAWFGKWHLSARDPAAPLVGEAHARTIVPPEARGGFRIWEGFESGFLINDPWLHGSRLPQPVKCQGYQSDVLCARAEAWMREASGESVPWFCVVSLESPHPPYDAASPLPGPALEAVILDENVPRGGEPEHQARRELAGYYAHIASTDRAIGRTLDFALNGSEAKDRETIVVVTSVHGDMHGAHGLFRKGWPHEQSVGVPLLICRTGSREGRVEHRPVSLLELGAMTRDWADGRSRSPTGAAVGISMPSVVELPRQCDRIWSGWRGEGWKVVFNGDGSPWMIFDLRDDPYELHNLEGTLDGRKILSRVDACRDS